MQTKFYILNDLFKIKNSRYLKSLFISEFGFDKDSFAVVDIIFSDDSTLKAIHLPSDITSKQFEKMERSLVESGKI